MTYLYQTVNNYNAVEAFRRMNRLDTGDGSGNFSPDAVHALVEYYHELAIAFDEPIEFDVIAWCCDWAQYENWLDAASEYDEVSDMLQRWTEENKRGALDSADFELEQIIEWFEDNTTIIEMGSDGVLIRAF